MAGFAVDLNTSWPLGMATAVFFAVGQAMIWLRSRVNLDGFFGNCCQAWMAATAIALLLAVLAVPGSHESLLADVDPTKHVDRPLDVCGVDPLVAAREFHRQASRIGNVARRGIGNAANLDSFSSSSSKFVDPIGASGSHPSPPAVVVLGFRRRAVHRLWPFDCCPMARWPRLPRRRGRADAASTNHCRAAGKNSGPRWHGACRRSAGDRFGIELPLAARAGRSALVAFHGARSAVASRASPSASGSQPITRNSPRARLNFGINSRSYAG